jgi:prevent-host-death family protein
MFNIAEDICSMTEFKRKTSEVATRLRGTGRALILTTNGKADLVVQDAASYQKLLERLEAFENQGVTENAAASGLSIDAR